MRAVYVAAAIALSVLANNASAAWTTASIARIYPNPYGRVYFWLNGDTCKNSSSGKYWYFELGTDQADAWFALMLSAANNGEQIVVIHPTCNSGSHQAIDYMYQNF